MLLLVLMAVPVMAGDLPLCVQVIWKAVGAAA